MILDTFIFGVEKDVIFKISSCSKRQHHTPSQRPCDRHPPLTFSDVFHLASSIRWCHRSNRRRSLSRQSRHWLKMYNGFKIPEDTPCASEGKRK
ncbi:hypothetical protein AAHA92_09700 [Salvia divinorum]|uniref:Uncharacterized protein n=1 Tax=Salvia divinorum TaxID=28513 RepID=A0ABD1HS93_SALDI